MHIEKTMLNLVLAALASRAGPDWKVTWRNERQELRVGPDPLDVIMLDGNQFKPLSQLAVLILRETCIVVQDLITKEDEFHRPHLSYLSLRTGDWTSVPVAELRLCNRRLAEDNGFSTHELTLFTRLGLMYAKDGKVYMTDELIDVQRLVRRTRG